MDTGNAPKEMIGSRAKSTTERWYSARLMGCDWHVRDAEFFGQSGKSRIRGPEAISTNDRRGQQVDINPSDPMTMQTAFAYEGDDLRVRNRGCLMHLLISVE